MVSLKINEGPERKGLWLAHITWNQAPESKALPFITCPHSTAGASGRLWLDVMKLVRAVSRYFGGFTSGAFHQHVLSRPASQAGWRPQDKGETEAAGRLGGSAPLLCL